MNFEKDYTIPYEVVKEVDEINHGLDVSELQEIFPTLNKWLLKRYKSMISEEKNIRRK